MEIFRETIDGIVITLTKIGGKYIIKKEEVREYDEYDQALIEYVITCIRAQNAAQEDG